MLKPEWVVPRRDGIAAGHDLRKMLRGLGLSTVCESARCPNRGECFSDGTATFLILGRICTRRCGFCAVDKGEPAPPGDGEAKAVAEAVNRLGTGYAVVTSVTRDDLEDGGASVFAEVVEAVRERNPETVVELLIPDFGGEEDALEKVIAAAPDVLNHNIETVPRLYRQVRPGARYRRSLDILRRVGKTGSIIAKSGLMLGLGEEDEEIVEVMRDLAANRCRCLTLGQYLQPMRVNLPVMRYRRPEEFEALADKGRKLGIDRVVAGPLVRSSYRAAEVYSELKAAEAQRQ